MLEALISLPLLSFFALPMLSSYSTSLNLLFFWMTWSTLVLSHKPINVIVFGTLMVRILFYILPSSLFLAFDTLLPGAAINIKAQGNVALAHRYGRQRVAKLVGVSLFNIALSIALSAGLDVLFTDVLRRNSPLQIATRLPMPYSIAIDLGRGFAIRGVVQYYIHRYLLHDRRYGGFLTTLHNTWAHSIHSPVPFMATYDHPLTYILHKIVPTYLPAIIFRYHVLTFQLMLALISLEDVFTYSGYNVLPSSIMLPGMARRRDMHFLTKGNGNYAPFGLLDWVHGTSCADGADVLDDIEEEMDKHDVKRRTNLAIDDAGNFMQGSIAKAKRKASRGKKSG